MKNIVKVCFGSWKAYNESNDRALGSSFLDLAIFDTVEKVKAEMKKEGFTDEELEETFIQDYEAEGFDDVMLFSNCDMISISEALECYKRALTELEAAQENQLKYTLSINKYKAVEVHFDEKPSQEVIDTLKQNGFRWFKPSASWSAFKTLEEAESILKGNATIGAVEPKKYQYKGFELIEDYQTKFDIISEKYIGGLKTWDKTPKDREYRDNHIIGSTIVLKTKEGKYILIDNDKPSISSTLWYDDETECPENSYSNFEAYNMRHNLHGNFLKNSQFLTKNDYKPDIFVDISDRTSIDDDYIRDLTNDEQEDIRHIFKEREENYKKRLLSYWKRYQKNIHWSGYWANR